MSNVCFSIEQIKSAAFNALSDATVSDDLLASHFRGMTLLISALESSAASMADMPVTDVQQPKPAPQTKPKKEGAAYTGYMAKLKNETLDRLLAARKNGVTIGAIASKAKDLTEAEIYTALQAGKLPFDRWELIAGALNALDKEKKNG